MESATKRPRVGASDEDPTSGLVLMILDVEDSIADTGSFLLWCLNPAGETVLLRICDFRPYFFILAPSVRRQDGSPRNANEHDFDELQRLLNFHLPQDQQIISISTVWARPIMFYRPSQPQGDWYLQLFLKPGSNAKKAGELLHHIAKDNKLQQQGVAWNDPQVFETDVKPLTKVMTDLGLSAGGWIYVPQQNPIPPVPQTLWTPSTVTSGFIPVPAQSRISSCQLELYAPGHSLQCLSQDATQLADHTWCPRILTQLRVTPHNASESAGAHTNLNPGHTIPPAIPVAQSTVQDPCTNAQARSSALSIHAHTILPPNRPGQKTWSPSTPDAHPPTPDFASWTSAPLGSVSGPQLASHLRVSQTASILAMRVLALDVLMAPHDGSQRTPNPLKDPVVCIGASLAQFRHGGHAGQEADGKALQVAFLHSTFLAASHPVLYLEGCSIHSFHSERDLLLAWRKWVLQHDPDALAVYQVRDNLGVLQARFDKLRLEGGSLHLSRLVGPYRRPLSTKSVVMYSVAWVKQQARMASTSNQETFKASIAGRLVFDVLRQILTSENLASFTLVDCCQSLLSQTLEVLAPHHLAQLCRAAGQTTTGAGSVSSSSIALTPEQAATRLARYSMRRVSVVQQLLGRMATIPEVIEMARATGLTVSQVLYNAQMIRTWNLLLRNAHRQQYIIGGRHDPGALAESPFLLHPVENNAAGFYHEPVVLLDFASLYPSLYRSYNLCYTTLMVPQDVKAMDPASYILTPNVGAAFVKPEVRQGVLPAILAALMTARTKARAALKTATNPGDRAVLDGRQKALKTVANALYGFTGAQASPLQCIPLADSCLSLGAASCRRAMECVTRYVAQGRLVEGSSRGRVIYAQTDSLFVHFPAATTQQAVKLGKQIAAMVTSDFPGVIELKYEQVLTPFLLLHVNRYAGRSFVSEEDVERERGKLLVKGIKSMWRQSAPLVREVLQGCLDRIIMQQDIRGAVAFAEEEVHRLLSGRVEMSELVMTGGLWRVTGQQVEKAAESGNGGLDEDIRGPHSALAVKMTQRDPGKRFLLGERIQYVLLSGARLQVEAAECPLLAAQQGLSPNYELYWRNKLQVPLKEIFQTCLTPAELQSLLNGQHTMVKVDTLSASGSTPVRGFGINGGGTGNTTPQKARGNGQQKGMVQFFKQSDRCLNCKKVLPRPKSHSLLSQSDTAPARGLCLECKSDPDAWPSTWLGLMREVNQHTCTQASAMSACIGCHSGGLLGPVLCENGECKVLFARVGAARRLAGVHGKLDRLEW